MILPISTLPCLRCLMLLAACTAVACGALAQSGQDTGEVNERAIESLVAADSNNDGLLVLAELTVMLDERFARMDRNGDGLVADNDAPRLARGQFMSRVGPVIEERDGNGDGVLSYSEFSARPLENFNRADEDGDGVVELSTLVDMLRTQSESDN